jgi:hypothetical protein
MPETYDVCLSFAGEDREYVEEVAGYLKINGVNVFYDSYLETNLWGKDLYQHLSEVYQSANFAIIFISEAYSKKLWTTHELKACQARAFKEKGEYILPIRFDDTEISGIHTTLGFLDARIKDPYEIARAIIDKLVSPSVTTFSNEHPYYITFRNMNDFTIWHNQVSHLKGWPMYGRNSKTLEINFDSQKTEKWCDPIKNKDDERVAAIVKENRLPIEMIDDAAKRRYNFERRSLEVLKQMGF